MLTNLIFGIFRVNIKSQFHHRFTLFFEMISIIISLTIYHFTSQAFKPAIELELENYHMNYFNYILIGDLFLSIPLYFVEAPFRNLRISTIEGTWQSLISLPINKFKILFIISLMDLPRTFLRTCTTFSLAYIFFGLNLNMIWVFYALLLQLVSLPFCFGLGLVAASVYILTGKGQAVVGYFSTLTAFFAGALFPIDVFPEAIRRSSLILSPITLLLESTRKVLSTGDLNFSTFFILLAWGIILILGLVLFNFALERRKKSGDKYLLI